MNHSKTVKVNLNGIITEVIMPESAEESWKELIVE